MIQPNRALVIHDFSLFGRCSLSIALPVLSAAGVETIALPTALYSYHTGGLGSPHIVDLTDEMPRMTRKWQELGLKFGAIYTGYQTGTAQIQRTLDVIGELSGEDTLLLVDPAMADNGRMYSSLPGGFASDMRRLCEAADIITPNVTEAALLLGREFEPGLSSTQGAKELMSQLKDQFNARHIVLTGVNHETDIGALVFDRREFTLDFVVTERVELSLHGTGDLFASAMLGGIMRGKTVTQAVVVAARLVCNTIKRTADAQTDKRFGLIFEPEIQHYIEALEK